MGITRFERWGTKALASTAASRLTPDVEVSDRTYATYKIGAMYLIRHLIEGDWHAKDSYDKRFMEELLSRVIANAQRQGVQLNLQQAQTTATPEEAAASSVQVYTEVALMYYGLGQSQTLTPRFIASHLSKPALDRVRELHHGPDETFRDTLMSNLHREGIITWNPQSSTALLGNTGTLLAENYLAAMAPNEHPA